MEAAGDGSAGKAAKGAADKFYLTAQLAAVKEVQSKGEGRKSTSALDSRGHSKPDSRRRAH
jgi:hypothetical protein